MIITLTQEEILLQSYKNQVPQDKSVYLDSVWIQIKDNKIGVLVRSENGFGLIKAERSPNNWVKFQEQVWVSSLEQGIGDVQNYVDGMEW